MKEKYNLPLIELETKKELAKFFKKEEVSFIYVKSRGFLKKVNKIQNLSI